MSDFLDGLKADLESTIKSRWESRNGQVVPKNDEVALGNDRVLLDAVLLYADLADSTELAIKNLEIASEVFKAYLNAVTKIIRSNGGHIRSFDGDRVMGVFIGDWKATPAVQSGLQIQGFFKDFLAPRFREFYGDRVSSVNFNQTVGIDRSPVHVVRTGIRRNNDLIWVGRAPNVAAKLSNIRDANYKTLITPSVFDILAPMGKIGQPSGLSIWTQLSWTAGAAYGVPLIYGSGWTWAI